MMSLYRVHAIVLVGKLLSQVTKFIYALPHDYILKSFHKRHFVFGPDRGLEKVLYKWKDIENFK